MEEKKLTDEEIVRAILQSIEYSKTITYFDEWGNCKSIMVTDILNFIHRLQDENEQLKSTKHRASWKAKFFKAQEEIERLKEEKTKEVFGLLDQYEKAEADVHSMEREADGYRKTISELQKQVDELKTENTELYKEHTTVIAGSILQKKQAVKDTAREICLKIIKGQPQPIKEKWVEWFKKEYGVEVE